MRRLIYILLAVAMVVALFPNVAYATSLSVPPARLIIDNYEIRGLDVPPVIRNNTTMVPARAVFEHVGGTVSGANNYREITVNFRGDILVMNVGNSWAQLNGGYMFMEEPPVVIQGRTLIPLRFTAEAFGFYVDWDRIHRAAILISPPYDTNPPEDSVSPEPTPTPGPEYVTRPDHTTDPTPSPPPHGPNMAIDISTAPISFAPHPTTSIVSMLTPREMGVSAYSIVASSPITDVNHFMLADNRLVVDIYNSIHNLNGPFYASAPVSRVGTSQFSNAPDVTRVVFHIMGPAEFSVSLSYDRRIITVAFTSNTISAVLPTSTAYSDSFHIQGNFQPSIRMSSAGYPRYITIYIDNARMSADGAEIEGGNFGTHFTTGRALSGVAYVRIYMRGGRWPSISLNHGSNQVSIIMHDGLVEYL